MVENLIKISVVMPVYNADRFLEESIESILKQTYTNFEFIIICSDPTEKTKKILNMYQRIDTRILIIYEEKKGIIFARNMGCQQAKGDYIAVMDADDVSSPNRFETQITFMEKHPDIGIVGSWADLIDENGKIFEKGYRPTNPFVIGWHLLFWNCMMHSTILIRSEVLKQLQYYSQAENGFPEDYDLWTRSFFITKIANIPKSLAKHRMHTSNNSLGASLEMIQFGNTIQHNMIKKLLGERSQPFLSEILIQKNSLIFNFNPYINDIQVDLIETLYQHYINRYFPPISEINEIDAQIFQIFLTYSMSMFWFSKTKSWSLLIKSLHYLRFTGIKELTYAIREKTIAIYHQNITCIRVKRIN